MHKVDVKLVNIFDFGTLLQIEIITSKADIKIKPKLIIANLFFFSSIVQEFIVRKPATVRVKKVNNKSSVVPFNFTRLNSPKMAINVAITAQISVNNEILFFIKSLHII